MSSTMTAAVLHAPGGPGALLLETLPIPVPILGQVLIRVKAFGLNRSELFTRQGLSPDVKLPRVLGIEAVGLVDQCPGAEFAAGDIVATAMGGMGRDFDGGYAEFVCVPASQVQRLQTSLPWSTLGALPEMLQTSWGSLFRALTLKKGQRLLIRGGTTSIGLTAAAIAADFGAFVASTTRNPARAELLRRSGAQQVFIDTGSIERQVHESYPGGVDKVLELIGATTLADSLRCTKEQGTICMTGMVGNKWSFDNFSPMEVIPTGVNLTTYDGGTADFMATPLQQMVDRIAAATMHVSVGRTFALNDIVAAHEAMEANTAGGKIVVLT